MALASAASLYIYNVTDSRASARKTSAVTRFNVVLDIDHYAALLQLHLERRSISIHQSQNYLP